MDQECSAIFLDAALRQRFLVVTTESEAGVRSAYLAEPDDSGRAIVVCFCESEADLMDFADTHDGVYLSDDYGDAFEYSGPNDLLDLLQCEADGFNLFAVCPESRNVVACTVPDETLEAF